MGATLSCGARAPHGSGFSCCGAQVLGVWASVIIAWRFSSCGSPAQLPHGMWDLPGPGSEPVSPAWAGGFLTTGLPGSPSDPLSAPLDLLPLPGSPPSVPGTHFNPSDPYFLTLEHCLQPPRVPLTPFLFLNSHFLSFGFLFPVLESPSCAWNPVPVPLRSFFPNSACFSLKPLFSAFRS